MFFLYILCILAVSTFFSSSLTSLSQQHSSSDCWIFHNIKQFSFFLLDIMCSPFFFSPLSLQASCVSLINLYHSLVNCLTFTSCVWGACLSKWNGSAILQGQINHLVFFTCISFFSCHPFIRLRFVEGKGYSCQTSRQTKRQETSLTGQEKQETSQHLPQEV